MRCRALQSLTKIIKTRYQSYLQGSTGRGESGDEVARGRRRRVQARRHMADNPPDPHHEG
eukprot:1137475-Pelagomonas_calceolata.AAC.2